jgi:hypothetical protein
MTERIAAARVKRNSGRVPERTASDPGQASLDVARAEVNQLAKSATEMTVPIEAINVNAWLMYHGCRCAAPAKPTTATPMANPSLIALFWSIRDFAATSC